MRIKNFFKLVIAIGISCGAGVVGSFFTAPAVQSVWYAELVKPTLNPPAWVFGPVWTTLFALMGVSAWLVWKQWDNGSPSIKLRVKIALAIFIGQLVLNTLWLIIFFGLHSPGGALVEIVFLWFAILATIIAFAKISPPSHKATDGQGNPAVHPVRAFIVSNGAWLLLLPYLLWVSFAGYLNYAIWSLN
jgi:tryptophan-rich sensory protein